MFWCWRPVHRVVRQVQVQESKTTWGFQLVSQARILQVGLIFRHRSSAPRFSSPEACGSTAIINLTLSKSRMELEFPHVPLWLQPGYPEAAVRKITALWRRRYLLRCDTMEAQLCYGEEVIVVGGGNSAGQAAVFLAENAKRTCSSDLLVWQTRCRDIWFAESKRRLI